MIIKDGAIFIADAHYNRKRETLLDLLEKINLEKKEIPQLFLMGDIFDFLCGQISYFQEINQKIINLINEISHSIEIIYFEGNHDFNLIEIFPKIAIIPREQQPIHIQKTNKVIALAHGDIFTPMSYNIFTAIFRNKFFLKLLNFLNFKNKISIKAEKRLMKKKICHPQKNFVSFVQNRIANYNVDLVIEGHFHQGYQDEKYINIPSLACDNRYMIYKNNQFNFISI